MTQSRQEKPHRSEASGQFVTTVYPKHKLGATRDGRSGVTEKFEKITKK